MFTKYKMAFTENYATHKSSPYRNRHLPLRLGQQARIQSLDLCHSFKALTTDVILYLLV